MLSSDKPGYMIRYINIHILFVVFNLIQEKKRCEPLDFNNAFSATGLKKKIFLCGSEKEGNYPHLRQCNENPNLKDPDDNFAIKSTESSATMPICFKDSWLTIRKHKVSRLSLFSYIMDWALYLAILIGFMIYGSLVPPVYHEFLLEDISLMNSYKPEGMTLVPMPVLILIAVVFPMLQIILCSVLQTNTLHSTRKVWDIFIGMTSLCGAMSIQLMMICILKNICGLPRPDLISRCDPDYSIDFVSGRLATVDVCQSPDLVLVSEGFRSFPSGHSSTVFCGMILASLNISAKLQIFDSRGVSLKFLLVIIPIMIACFVSCSRISDNRHFLRDVIGGLAIGAGSAIFFYLQYFPWITKLENCGRAYPPRRIGVSVWCNNIGGFWKINDKLDGSYQERCLNDVSIIELIKKVDCEFSIDSTEFIQTDRNIEYFNRLSEKFKHRIFNISNKQRATNTNYV